MKSEIRVLKAADVKLCLPQRMKDSDKGDYGKAAILAGSMHYSGAALLAAQGALCGGAGYVALCVPDRLKKALIGKIPEAILLSSCSGGEWKLCRSRLKSILQYNVIAAGMGMGNTKSTAKIVGYLLRHYEGKLLLDADALNALAKHFGVVGAARRLREKRCFVLLTPHPVEFSRLTGISKEDLLKNGSELAVQTAKNYAEQNRVTILLKGITDAKTLITNGELLAMNVSGNSGQAKGGTGDSLSGLIASIAASGADLFSAANAAAYLMGKAAENAAKQISERALTASIICSYLGKTMLDL